MSDTDPGETGRDEGSSPEPLTCDFCGETVTRVRRVALDRDYDRLQKPHRVQYACEACSAEKERLRQAEPRG